MPGACATISLEEGVDADDKTSPWEGQLPDEESKSRMLEKQRRACGTKA
jgi:hypothetical protein